LIDDALSSSEVKFNERDMVDEEDDAQSTSSLEPSTSISVSSEVRRSMFILRHLIL